MSRFYVPKEKVNQARNEILIDGEEAHHILDVMRLKDGDTLVVFDGTGVEYSGFIKKADPRSKALTVEIIRIDKPAAEKIPEIILAQAIPKKAKMEHIIEKATELGVSRVIPLVTGRTIVRPDETGREKKVSRWKKIAAESSKQCGRVDVPPVEDITRFEDLVKTLDEYDLALLAHVSEKTEPIKKALADFRSGKIIVFIGPEGDFTPDEVKMTEGKGNCRLVSLGSRVLRADTAGLFVLSVLNYEFSM
ncbi:MAG: 16S rRNA (uracil(1498)-N(3))-methyltransferase [Candidatus Omnitrophota bacterium]